MTNQKRMAPRLRNARTGLTLIEVMIATTITLLMMLALAQGFKTLSQTVSEGRSKLILSDQLRGLSQLLRNDLEGRTTDSSTPQSGLLPLGYFKYYDGPISDTTAALFNHLPTMVTDSTVESRLSASRWGDIDDILMFTAKASPGQVFRGKVPWSLLLINMMNVDPTFDPPTKIADWTVPDVDGDTGWTKAWKIDVTISSEYAEIVWFMMPMNEFNSIDPNNPDMMVFDVAPGVDRDGDGSPDTDGMPDRIALCRRVLLIRPDLNITPTAPMIGTAVINGGTSGSYLTMQPRQPVLGSAVSVNSFRFMMEFPYQRCDLSIRPVAVPVSTPINGLDFFTSIGTNSLESLQLLENRFGHYGCPIGKLGTTLPALALSSELAAPSYLAMTNPVFASLGIINPVPAFIGMDATQTSFRDRGFLPSCFMRTKPVTQTRGVFNNVPLLEEVVASNVVAFDLKGFDTSVAQLTSPGPDDVKSRPAAIGWGAALIDDNGDGTIDNVAEAGWPGTDDLGLTPSDPGYAVQLAAIATGGATYKSQSGTGAYVDAGWGSKVYNSKNPTSTGTISLALLPLTPAQWSNIIKFFPTSLSLIDVNAAANGLAPASSLYASGTFIDTKVHQVYQPAFDTFTTAYDYDGEAILRSPKGLIWQQGLRRFGFAPGMGGIDIGADTIDDDALDKEVIPQIPYRLPSIQATIRVQDVSAGTIQQISVTHDLTN